MNILRQKKGRGFSYRYEQGDLLSNSNPDDRELKEWIKDLAIPPAWQEVVITPDINSKVYAVGRDQNGKKQYVYNPEWRAQRNQEKFERIQRFARALPTMREVTTKHLDRWIKKSDSGDDETPPLDRDTVLACMVRLLDTAYFRPGNEQYTKQNESFGLTTLRTKHLEIEGADLTFEYKGKSGVEQVKAVQDQRLAKVIRELDETPGYRIFKYFDGRDKVYVTSDDLNAYIKSLMGEEFSAKDFRTWAGTAVAALALTEFEITDSESERDKNMLAAIEKVAMRLGNTPAICRENYIDPRILDAYVDGQTIAHIKESISQELNNDFLSADEFATLKLLEAGL